MSKILRNTFAMYAANNSTKYLRSMRLTNNSLRLQQNYSDLKKLPSSSKDPDEKKNNFWAFIRDAGTKISSMFRNDLTKRAKYSHFDVTLGINETQLILADRHRNITWAPSFIPKLNNKKIAIAINKPEFLRQKQFNFDQWVVELDARELKLRLQNSDETFILNHTVVVQAYEELIKNDDGCPVVFPKLHPNVKIYDAKITSSSESGEFTREYPVKLDNHVPADQHQHHGTEEDDMSEYPTQNDEITEKPNDSGKVKLQFPMTVSFEGSEHKIKIKGSNDYFIINHSVTINTMKDPRFSRPFTKKSESDQYNSLRISLDSGVITLSTAGTAHEMVFLKQEVDIVLDVDGEIPNIVVYPYVKASTSIETNV